MSKPRHYGNPYKTLGQYRGKLTRQQIQAMRGQIKSGHADDAMRGLEKLLAKRKEQEHDN